MFSLGWKDTGKRERRRPLARQYRIQRLVLCGSFSGELVATNLNATDNVQVEVLATPAFSLRKLDKVRSSTSFVVMRLGELRKGEHVR